MEEEEEEEEEEEGYRGESAACLSLAPSCMGTTAYREGGKGVRWHWQAGRNIRHKSAPPTSSKARTWVVLSSSVFSVGPNVCVSSD